MRKEKSQMFSTRRKTPKPTQTEGTGEERETYSANATPCKYCMVGAFWVVVGKQTSNNVW